VTTFFLRLKWVNKNIKLRVILGVLFVSGAIQAQQQMSAEWVETRLGELGHSRTYVGRVAYKDSLGAIQIEADSAVVKGALYVFVSNLRFQDSVRVVRANELRFNEKDHIAQFLGDVFFQDKKGALSAPEIQVWPDAQKLMAKGGVIFDLLSRSQRISANRLSFDGKNDVGIGVGGVVATMVGERGDSLRIQTDSLSFASEKEYFTFKGPSKIQQSGMRLLATQGKYSDGWLQTSGSPELNWSRVQQADSVWAKADTIEMRFEDQALQALSLFSGVHIQLSGAHQGSVQAVQGDSACISIVDKEISNLNVLGQAQLQFEKEEQTITLGGDSVSVWFTVGRLDSLMVYGQGDGRYQGKDGGVSRVSGKMKTLWFENDELVKMLIVGNAVCRYVAAGENEGNKVNFNGDTLVLDFDQSELSHIEVTGDVQGAYLQKKLGNVP
jgi:hypothetical protein